MRTALDQYNASSVHEFSRFAVTTHTRSYWILQCLLTHELRLKWNVNIEKRKII